MIILHFNTKLSVCNTMDVYKVSVNKIMRVALSDVNQIMWVAIHVRDVQLNNLPSLLWNKAEMRADVHTMWRSNNDKINFYNCNNCTNF